MWKDGWEQVPASYHEECHLKIDDLKYFECPLSAITPASWRLLTLVNESITPEGEYQNMQHLPRLVASIQAEELRYREAVRIVRAERSSEWFKKEQDDYFKRKNHGR